MRSLLLLTLVAAVAAWAVVRQLPENEAIAQPTLSSHPQEIRSIALDGGRGLPLSTLRAALTTRIGDVIDRDHLALDRAALQTALETRGYLTAKVAPPTVTFSNGGAYVMFSIDRGPAYHFRTIELVNVKERDAGVITIGAWDTANPERLERVRQALADVLTRQGKPARVTTELRTDVSASAVDVTIAVHEN